MTDRTKSEPRKSPRRLRVAVIGMALLAAVALGLAGALATFARWNNCYGGSLSFATAPNTPHPAPEVAWSYPRWTRDGGNVMFGATVTAYPNIWPDGDEITVSQTSQAYIASLDGLRLSPLDNPNWVFASVSPDGSRNAYPDGGGVAVSALDGSERRSLAHDNGYAHSIKWSPDGERIGFARSGASECSLLFFTDTPDRGLYTMKADGSEIHRALHPYTTLDGMNVAYIDGWNRSNWAWSPDSQSVGFSAVETAKAVYNINDDATSIYTVKADGSDLARLFTVPSSYGEDIKIKSPPAWSSGGERATFLMGEWDSVNLYTIAEDGLDLSDGIEIPEIGGNGVLSWNPINDSLILASNGSDSYIVNIADSSVLIISGGIRASWSPDGERVALIVEDGGWARFDGSPYALDIPSTSFNGGVGVFVMSPDGADARLLAVLGEDGTAK